MSTTKTALTTNKHLDDNDDNDDDDNDDDDDDVQSAPLSPSYSENIPRLCSSQKEEAIHDAEEIACIIYKFQPFSAILTFHKSTMRH